MLEAIAGVAGGLGGFGLDFAGQRYFQKKQNSFTEKMMKSKHQWQVEDLRKAGLNPILSATGGAPMGGSASASMPAQDPVGKGLAAAANAAQLRAVEAKAEADESGADIEKILNDFKMEMIKRFGTPGKIAMTIPKSTAAAGGAGLYGAAKVAKTIRRMRARPLPANTNAKSATATREVGKQAKAAAYKGTKLLPKKKAKANWWKATGVSGALKAFDPLMLILMMEEELRQQKWEKKSKDEKSYWHG